MSVVRFTPNHTPLKYRCPTKICNWLSNLCFWCLNGMMESWTFQMSWALSLRVHCVQFFKLEDVAMGIWISKFKKEKSRRVDYVNDENFCHVSCEPGYIIAHYQNPGQMQCLWNHVMLGEVDVCCNNDIWSFFQVTCDYCTYQTLSLIILNSRATHFVLKCGNACHPILFGNCSLYTKWRSCPCTLRHKFSKPLFHPHTRKISWQ